MCVYMCKYVVYECARRACVHMCMNVCVSTEFVLWCDLTFLYHCAYHSVYICRSIMWKLFLFICVFISCTHDINDVIHCVLEVSIFVI